MHPESQRKANRLNSIINLLWKRPNGLTTEELAREFGVDQRTIQRDLLDLQNDSSGVPLTRQGVRWALLAESQPLLSALRLTLAEATALLLAARLLQRASDEANPHVTAALAKLAAILPEALGEYLRQLLIIGGGDSRPGFVSTFEVLALSWATRRTARVRYQAASPREELDTDFDVYCLEPIAPSFAIYAVGFAHARGEVRTFKLERVASAELTDRHFEVEPGFDAQAYLASGWGIMGGSELRIVRLRLAPEAVSRLRESQFHPSQQIHDEPDGSCIVTFAVANPVELSAFIRGWGPRAEVLEPDDLRALIAREALETATLYAKPKLTGG